MKRFLAMFFCMMLLACGAPAEETAQYEAIASRDTYLVETPGGKSLSVLPEGEKVNVAEVGDEWSRIQYEEHTGYCKTKYLYHFVSLDPFRFTVPGYTKVDGFVNFVQPTFLEGGKFDGMEVQPQAIFCVSKTENGYTVPVWRGQTELLLEEVAFYPFVDWQNAGAGDVIGGFTTFYGEEQGKGKAAEREHNIVEGCRRIHETVLKPDEYFSFNALCAPYSQRNGYQYAPNISNKGFGYGGGVCQLTTTLYNAVLQLPLQVDEWAMHRYTGIAYAPQFFDAAVGSYSDFTFKNTLPYAIQIMAVPQDGVLTVLIVKQ